MTSKYTPQQMEQFKSFAKGFGIPDEALNQLGIKK